MEVDLKLNLLITLLVALRDGAKLEPETLVYFEYLDCDSETRKDSVSAFRVETAGDGNVCVVLT